MSAKWQHYSGHPESIMWDRLLNSTTRGNDHALMTDRESPFESSKPHVWITPILTQPHPTSFQIHYFRLCLISYRSVVVDVSALRTGYSSNTHFACYVRATHPAVRFITRQMLGSFFSLLVFISIYMNQITDWQDNSVLDEYASVYEGVGKGGEWVALS